MKVYRCFLFGLALVVTAEANEQFKGVDLWLPTSYQAHYKRFLEAAKVAQDDPYCAQLLSGRLDEARSNSEQVFFHFRCRTDKRESFSLQVNGANLQVKNDYAEQQEATQESRLSEEERRILAEKVAQRQREQKKYWKVCSRAIKKRLKSFDGVKFLSETAPIPEKQADQLTYTVFFDAQSQARKPLHFQVSCAISALDYYQVAIKARKKPEKSSR